MRTIYAEQTVSISELKRSPSSVIKKAGKEATAILNHHAPIARKTYEK